MKRVQLAYEAQEVLLPRGSVLVEEGEPGAAFYLIVDGFVDVEAGGDVGPGGVVGFFDVLTSGPALVGAVASTDVVALRVESDALRDVCEQNFAVLSAILTHVAGLVADDRGARLRSIAGRGAAELSVDDRLDRVDRIVAFHRAPAFPTRHMDALAELAGLVEQLTVEPGEILWREREEAGGYFLVAAGALELGDAGSVQGIQIGPGAVPGLVEMLAARRHGDELRVSKPSVLLRVDAEPFLDVLEDHFEMAFELLGSLAGHLSESRFGYPSEE